MMCVSCLVGALLCWLYGLAGDVGCWLFVWYPLLCGAMYTVPTYLCLQAHYIGRKEQWVE